MRAEFRIKLQQGDVAGRGLLERALGPHDPAVLANMPRYSSLAGKTSYYGFDAPSHRVVGWNRSVGEVQLDVEAPRGSRLEEACETVWSALVQEGGQPGPELISLRLIDDSTGNEYLRASTGLGPHARRPELRLTFVTAAGTIAWLVVALTVLGAPPSLLLGAAPAVITGVAALAFLSVDSYRKKLIWSSARRS